MTKKTKKIGAFLANPTFFDQKSLNWSNLVKTYRNSLLFFVIYSKLHTEHEYDVKNVIKCSFKELLAFCPKK
jgi:hypothetical protein